MGRYNTVPIHRLLRPGNQAEGALKNETPAPVNHRFCITESCSKTGFDAQDDALQKTCQ